RLNLTRVTNPREVARLHLLDSLAALPLVDRLAPGEVIDLGSGGGLPALPLAMARPQMRWTLVDSVAKKAAVLGDFAAALGLRNVTVIADRAEVLGRDPRHRERYDIATARACASLPVLAELALPLVAAGGSLIAWKGPLTEGDEEVRRGRAAIAQLGGGELRIVETGLPALGGHRLVVVPKERATDARFPRRPGEPGRRPLG
ncbi:MAG TPA: 16S rRNA (guanine(527)-N(7))-methyltransferase RsmG, partial [Candidatus Binatia bacterium]|nr:16S rRNA (guanine(527)-N(7))-methyltransferase RsmG [Candidatus Binatia bacterium]